MLPRHGTDVSLLTTRVMPCIGPVHFLVWNPYLKHGASSNNSWILHHKNLHLLSVIWPLHWWMMKTLQDDTFTGCWQSISLPIPINQPVVQNYLAGCFPITALIRNRHIPVPVPLNPSRWFTAADLTSDEKDFEVVASGDDALFCANFCIKYWCSRLYFSWIGSRYCKVL